MPKKAKELGPLEVKRLTRPGLHPVGQVPGLQLQVTSAEVRSWILRVMVGTKRRDIGLGGYPAVTLAAARDKAREKRDLIEAGLDPVLEARAAKARLVAAQTSARTFRQVADACIAAKSPEWKSAKHEAQWTATLEAYVYPFCNNGNLLVQDVGLPHVLAALEPIWTTKTETATRVRSRIEAVLDYAAARGYRPKGDNPARWKGHLDAILAKPRKVTKVEHHAALKLDEMPAFMARIREMEGTGARALEFAILTAARSGEVRGAKWSEVDLDEGVWIVPADRMKASREHRVPLSTAALKLLKAQHRLAGSDFVFPAARGGQLSDMTLSAVCRRMGVAAVPHGMRSTFKDWAAEKTVYPNEMSELALAHAVGDKTEAAYRRGDQFEKRRRMMSDWAHFIAKPQGANVIPMKRNRAAR